MQATAELFVHVMLLKSHRKKCLSQNPETWQQSSLVCHQNTPKLLLKRLVLKPLTGLLLLLPWLGSLQMHRHPLKRCVMDSSGNLRIQRELEKLLNQSDAGFISYSFHRRPRTRTHDRMIKWCNGGRTWRHQTARGERITNLCLIGFPGMFLAACHQETHSKGSRGTTSNHV